MINNTYYLLLLLWLCFLILIKKYIYIYINSIVLINYVHIYIHIMNYKCVKHKKKVEQVLRWTDRPITCGEIFGPPTKSWSMTSKLLYPQGISRGMTSLSWWTKNSTASRYISVYWSPLFGSHMIPSGKHTKNYGKSQFLMGKSTINSHFQ